MARLHGLALVLVLVLAACGDVHPDAAPADAPIDAPDDAAAAPGKLHGDIRTSAARLSGGRYRLDVEVGAGWSAGPAAGGGMRLHGGGPVTE